MRTTPTKLLYLGTAVAAVIMLVAGVSLSTVLIVVFVAVMAGMHLGGHGGHGGHGGQSHRGHAVGNEPREELPPAGPGGHDQHGSDPATASSHRHRGC